MNKELKYFIIGCGILLAFVSCKKEVTYESLIESGLRSGVKMDSLFLGYYFGMEQEEFYEHSWNLNRQGKITGLVKIEYRPDWLPYNSIMLFYPDFKDGKINNMPVQISYEAWAPWNRERSADSLMVHLVEHFEKEFGHRFHWLYVPELEKKAYFSMKGNQGIKISLLNDMIVDFEITDYSSR